MCGLRTGGAVCVPAPHPVLSFGLVLISLAALAACLSRLRVWVAALAAATGGLVMLAAFSLEGLFTLLAAALIAVAAAFTPRRGALVW